MSAGLDVAGQLDLHVSKQGHHLKLRSEEKKNPIIKVVAHADETPDDERDANEPQSLYFEELVNLAQVDPLFGVQLVDVTHVPVHQVETEAHHLSPAERQDVVGAQDRWTARGQATGHAHTQVRVCAWVEKKKKKCSYLKQHVFLTGSQIHFVLVIVNTDVDNVCQQLLIARDHLQLLVQALCRQAEALCFSVCVCVCADEHERTPSTHNLS